MCLACRNWRPPVHSTYKVFQQCLLTQYTCKGQMNIWQTSWAKVQKQIWYLRWMHLMSGFRCPPSVLMECFHEPGTSGVVASAKMNCCCWLGWSRHVSSWDDMMLLCCLNSTYFCCWRNHATNSLNRPFQVVSMIPKQSHMQQILEQRWVSVEPCGHYSEIWELIRPEWQGKGDQGDNLSDH